MKFDDMFINVIRETGGIDGILNAIFSFLLRRTDFFYEMDPGDKMGFPPGVAQKMVNEVFSAYQNQYY
jgi:N-terminal conserved domain of Nudc.